MFPYKNPTPLCELISSKGFLQSSFQGKKLMLNRVFVRQASLLGNE